MSRRREPRLVIAIEGAGTAWVVEGADVEEFLFALVRKLPLPDEAYSRLAEAFPWLAEGVVW